MNTASESDDAEDHESTESLMTCEGHGEQPPSFVCVHLAESQPDDQSIGFNWNCEGGDLLAYCDACEKQADAEGFISDVFFEENFAVICRSCFVEMAAVNDVTVEAISAAEAAAVSPPCVDPSP